MHKSQFSQVPSDNTPTAQERAAVRRARRGRTFAALGSAGALALMLFNAGCPGAADMEGDPGGGGPGGGSTGGSGGGGTICETQCVTDVFTKTTASCKSCHSSDPTLKYAMLDLQTANYTARLKNVPATFGDLSPEGTTPQAAGCPTGALLIDATYPGSSWLYAKIKGNEGNCGDKMPVGVPLTAAEITCLETYITCVADGKPITTVKPAGSGGSGGGGGGSGGSGGKAGGGGGGSGGSSGGSGGRGGAGGGGGSGGAN